MKNSILLSLISAIIGGIITAGANLYINYRQESQKLFLQKQQFESELILRAIIPDSIQRSKKNINIMVAAGFISDANEIINKINANDSLLDIHFNNYFSKKPIGNLPSNP